MKKIIFMMMTLVLSGCASIMGDETQSINLRTSDNKNVKVRVRDYKNEAVYTIPGKVTVARSHNDLIVTTVNTDCITPTKTVIPSKIDPKSEWIYTNVSKIEGLWHYDDMYTINVKRDNSCMQKAKALNDEIFSLHM